VLFGIKRISVINILHLISVHICAIKGTEYEVVGADHSSIVGGKRGVTSRLTVDRRVVIKQSLWVFLAVESSQYVLAYLSSCLGQRNLDGPRFASTIKIYLQIRDSVDERVW
jgi:hypothetical protein